MATRPPCKAFGAETEYTTFVNWAMNPNPALRPSAAEALKHPFLADLLLDEDSTRGLMKTLLTATQPPPAGEG